MCGSIPIQGGDRFGKRIVKASSEMTAPSVSTSADRLSSALAVFGMSDREWSPSAASFPNAIPSHVGLDADSFVLSRNGESPARFMKLHLPTAGLFNLNATVAAARQAGEVGVAPRLLSAELDMPALLFEHPGADWHPACAADFDMAPVIAGAVNSLKQWHQSPRLGMSSPTWIDLAETAERVVGLERLLQIVGAWAPLRAWTHRIGDVLRDVGGETAPLHREVFISNFMISSAGAMLLVDFDFAADGDPYADIGALALEVCDLEADFAQLVELYAGAVRLDLIARTKLYALLEDFRWGCIALIRHFDPEYPGAVDYLAYGKMRLSRCLGHLLQWNTASLLAEVG